MQHFFPIHINLELFFPFSQLPYFYSFFITIKAFSNPTVTLLAYIIFVYRAYKRKKKLQLTHKQYKFLYAKGKSILIIDLDKAAQVEEETVCMKLYVMKHI